MVIQTPGETDYHNILVHMSKHLTIMILFQRATAILLLCLNFIDNCIGAKVFSEMTEEEVNDPSLGFSFGAKKILKKILAQIKV